MSGRPSCPVCGDSVVRKRWYVSRKFWCVMLGMATPPMAWGTIQLPISYVLAMMFPPMAWGFGEWMLDFVKELTRMLSAWRQAGVPVGDGSKA